MTGVLTTRGLTKRYAQRAVVDGVGLEVKRGEVVGLLGPNGAGKTTTFSMIAGGIRPDGGRVLLGDRDITGLPMYRRARLGVVYLPQEASIFRRLTVAENVLAILETVESDSARRRGRPPVGRRVVDRAGRAPAAQSARGSGGDDPGVPAVGRAPAPGRGGLDRGA
jgi:lipopolysaccharide export system ATP-binding protein